MSSANSNDKYVRMANQIASFFRSYPDEEAVAGIHKHLHSFWTPKMIRMLVAYVPEAGDRLDPLVIRAIENEPRGESPVRAATSDPQLAGEGASDAG